MTRTTISIAIREAERFIEKAQDAIQMIHSGKVRPELGFGCKETAACRRASLDLTRALAQMRKRI